jgi:PilZ domain
MAARDHFRAHARRRVELGASLRARDGASRQEVRIRDVGLGGVSIEILEKSEPAAPLEREAPVTIEVMAPTLWDPLVLSGKIAWIRRGAAGRPTRAGVRFEHREPGAIFALFQLLGAHAFDA